MGADAKWAMRLAARWTFGYTPEQRLRFLRGAALGFLLAILLSGAACVLTFAIKRPWERAVEEAFARDIARLSGYSSCCMDVMAIMSNGGGVDEVIGFIRAKGEVEFSTFVSPEDFYPVSKGAGDEIRR